MTGGSNEQSAHPAKQGDGQVYFNRVTISKGDGEVLITLACISRTEALIIAQRLALHFAEPLRVRVTWRSDGAVFSCWLTVDPPLAAALAPEALAALRVTPFPEPPPVIMKITPS